MKGLLFTDRFSDNPGELVKVIDIEKDKCEGLFLVKLGDKKLEEIIDVWEPGEKIKYDFGSGELIIGKKRVKR